MPFRSLVFAIAVSALLLYSTPLSAQALVPQIDITFDTEEANPAAAGDYYAPSNVVAVWVEDELGAFVSTVSRTQSGYTTHLVDWQAMSPAGDIDGVSGATRGDHLTPVTATWDVLDVAGDPLPNGTYVLALELADSNTDEGTGANNIGRFLFTVDGTEKTDQPAPSDGFSNIAISYALVEPEGTPDNENSDDPGAPDDSSDSEESATVGTPGTAPIEGGCSVSGSGDVSLLLLLGLAALMTSTRRRRKS